MKLNGKVVVVTGAGNGMGRELTLQLIKKGAKVAAVDIRAESLAETKELASALGGVVETFTLDISDVSKVLELPSDVEKKIGSADVLINNASAIQLTNTLNTDMKKFDLMHQVNARGSYLCAKACLPYLLKAENPHIITLSPPLNMETKWFKHHLAYSMAKFGMSMVTLGLAGEFEGKVAVNSLWPKTIIATAAIEFAVGNAEMLKLARKPSIMADAAFEIVQRDAKTYSGKFLIDEDVLREAGVSDFSMYKNDPNVSDAQLIPDFFI